MERGWRGVHDGQSPIVRLGPPVTMSALSALRSFRGRLNRRNGAAQRTAQKSTKRTIERRLERENAATQHTPVLGQDPRAVVTGPTIHDKVLSHTNLLGTGG